MNTIVLGEFKGLCELDRTQTLRHLLLESISLYNKKANTCVMCTVYWEGTVI